MKTVACILRMKGHEVWTISPNATVYEALQLMAEKDVGALPVVDGHTLVGMISERDYARKVILSGRMSKETLVHEVMSYRVIWTSPDEATENCMSLMTARHIRHLPVLEDGRLTGMVSIGDLVKSIVSDQKELIRRLENHIQEAASLV